jgi:hypothetical protein
MWKPVVLMVAVALGFAGPAAAKTYYVAQNVKTMNCIVTPTKPNGTSYMMVGTMTFTAVPAALKDMASEDACKMPTKVAVKTTTTKPTTPKPVTATTTTTARPAGGTAY